MRGCRSWPSRKSPAGNGDPGLSVKCTPRGGVSDDFSASLPAADVLAPSTFHATVTPLGITTPLTNSRCPKIASPLRAAVLVESLPDATSSNAPVLTSFPCASSCGMNRFRVAATMLFMRTLRLSRVNVPVVPGQSHFCSSRYDAPLMSERNCTRQSTAGPFATRAPFPPTTAPCGGCAKPTPV